MPPQESFCLYVPTKNAELNVVCFNGCPHQNHIIGDHRNNHGEEKQMQKAVIIAICFQIKMPFAIFSTNVTDRINTG